MGTLHPFKADLYAFSLVFALLASIDTNSFVCHIEKELKLSLPKAFVLETKKAT